jgi:hypothetical protein
MISPVLGSPTIRQITVPYRRRFIMMFMDALGLQSAAMVGHSKRKHGRSKRLRTSKRISKIMILELAVPAAASEGQKAARGPAEGRRNSRRTDPRTEPRVAEHNLFNHNLITPEELEVRQRMSVGKNFEAFLKRSAAGQGGGGAKDAKPMWQRLIELPSPLLLMFGKMIEVMRRARHLAQGKYPSSICISSTIANTSCNGMRRRSFTNEPHNFCRIRPLL